MDWEKAFWALAKIILMNEGTIYPFDLREEIANADNILRMLHEKGWSDKEGFSSYALRKANGLDW